MKDFLIQQGVHKALLGKEKKPEQVKDEKWVEMDEKAASAIRLNCKGSLRKTRSSLYKKGTEKQIACEEATLQFTYEGGFRFVGASQHF